MGVVRTKAEADGSTARVRTTMAAICKVDEDLLVIIIELIIDPVVADGYYLFVELALHESLYQRLPCRLMAVSTC
jgi:hypothetical protein